MAKRNIELRDSLKKANLEKEALEQSMITIENKVASLKKERISLKENLARQKGKNTRLLKKKDLFKNMD